MKGLNLSKFKKLHSNEHTTTMAHPDGHQIRIAHSKLAEEHRKQLMDLPKFSDGGEVKVENWNHDDPNLRKSKKRHETEAYMGYVDQPTEDYDASVKRAKSEGRAVPDYRVPKGTKSQPGNALPNYAEGGAVEDETQNALDYLDPNAEMSTVNNTVDVTPVNNVDEQIRASMNPGSAPGAFDAGQPPPMLTPQEQAPVGPDMDPYAASGNAPATMPQPAVPEQPNMTMQGVNMQRQALQGEARAIGAQGRQEAQVLHERQAAMQEMNNTYQQKAKEITDEVNAITADYKAGHIDPNHFYNSKSDSGKTMTAIGLILGGIGGALTGQENPALKFLNNQIDRDIDAQKMELGKKHNLLAALNQQMGNLKDATQMSRMVYADIFNDKLQEAAARSKDPIAMQRAKQFEGQILAKYGPGVDQLAKSQAADALYKQGKVAAEAMVPFKVPKEQQQEAFKELQRTNEIRKQVGQLKQNMSEVAKLQSVGSRLANPVQSKRTIDALNLTIGAMGKGIFGNMSETEQEMLRKSEIGFADDAKTVARKTKVLEDILMSKYDSPLLKSYGLEIKPIGNTKHLDKNKLGR